MRDGPRDDWGDAGDHDDRPAPRFNASPEPDQRGGSYPRPFGDPPQPYSPPGYSPPGYSPPGYSGFGYSGFPSDGAPPYPGYDDGYSGLPTKAHHDPGATTSLVVGLVSFVVCPFVLGPAAIVEGHKARQRIRRSNGMVTGEVVALAGIICGGIATAVCVLLVAFVIVRANTPTLRVR